jgi:hypothetical protein
MGFVFASFVSLWMAAIFLIQAFFAFVVTTALVYSLGRALAHRSRGVAATVCASVYPMFYIFCLRPRTFQSAFNLDGGGFHPLLAALFVMLIVGPSVLTSLLLIRSLPHS